MIPDSLSTWVAAFWFLFLAGWVTGEGPCPPDNSQHLCDMLITTCHLNFALIPSPLSESAGGVWSTADIFNGRRLVRDSWWHSPSSGPQSCWMSFRRRCRFSTSCRRPCSWWWAGGRWSRVVPSSQLMPSGWGVGSSFLLGHYCTLK